ncbi:hypothetical protein BP5796_00707 [Coleophoma crateriformis]|uniref:Protection of telomeres protein 1 ssDNA-binding domain-containing protein n=1 Tax=Coleophoma crateriformis TaxID=565419 RepID=A0A3D8T8U7_9HELO|nr:hypothetical protein BP5796_00707 [Coleophoma crateriformis]
MEDLGDQAESTACLMKPPTTFETIAALLNIPDSRLLQQPLVNVIGFVKDFRAPIKTNGMGKSQVYHRDSRPLSAIFKSWFSDLHLFPLGENAQNFRAWRFDSDQESKGEISLLSNKYSEFHIVPAKEIPNIRSPMDAQLWQSIPAKSKKPSQAEANYALWASSHMEEGALPPKEDFQDECKKSMNVKEKFSLLKDVKSGQFYDVIGEVVKIFQANDYLTIYLSDYTANPAFYNYTWPGHNHEEGCDGDEYNYLKHKPDAAKEWPGPFGKTVIQITTFDCHAQFMANEVRTHDFVLLKNIQIKYGKSGTCLEGFLRGDREREGQVQVEILKSPDDVQSVDSRYKEAIRRKREWWAKYERQKRSILTEKVEVEDTRKRNENESIQTKSSSKKRRQERRAAAEKAVLGAEKRFAQRLNLNEHVRCIHPEKPTLSLLDIKSLVFSKSTTGHAYTLPFVNANYKANVRVVDFFPAKLEDFAVGRRVSEYDILSDYSGGEETDRDEDMRSFRAGKGFPEKKWEWVFALQVEDASSAPMSAGTSSSNRLWLTVDNQAAQMLLNIEEDAMDLRRNQHVLGRLRERLCILWGDLEEQKTRRSQQVEGADILDRENPASSLDSVVTPTASLRNVGDQPDLDSDIEDQYQQARSFPKKAQLKNYTVDASNVSKHDTNSNKAVEGSVSASNKAFTCCIKQYGIKVPESDIMKADAGAGFRWERKYGMFGTTIL